MIKSRRMIWAGHVARIGDKRIAYRILLGGWTILKCILDSMKRYGLNLSGSGWGQVEGFCEHGNEPFGSIKCWEIHE
jgi:hypothetical protein